MKKDNFLFGAGFYFLFLLIPFLYTIAYTGYGFFKLEIIFLYLCFLCLAILLSGIEKFTGEVGYVMLGTFILLFCLSYFPILNPVLSFPFFVILVFILMFFLGERFRQIAFISGFVFLLGILIFPVGEQLTAPQLVRYTPIKINKELPPIIHIILDEHAGIGGFPSNKDSQLLKKKLRQFYLKNGFELYSNTYSHYVRTFNSISNLINFSVKDKSGYYFKNVDVNVPEKIPNRYFEIMTQKGYRIRAYQFNYYFNYCDKNKFHIQSCYTVPATSLIAIQHLNLSLWNRFIFVFKYFLLDSKIYQAFLNFYLNDFTKILNYFHIHVPTLWEQARLSAVYFPAVFHILQQDLQNDDARGTLYFAHILAPHNPYVYDENCHVVQPAYHWQINISDSYVSPNTPESRQMRYKLYENQVRCVMRHMENLFTTLKKLGLYDKAIIIVQGDHGSRITRLLPAVENMKLFNQQNFKDCFVAMYAVKMPGEKPQYINKAIPLQNAFSHTINKITGANIELPFKPPFVYMIRGEVGAAMQPLPLNLLKMRF